MRRRHFLITLALAVSATELRSALGPDEKPSVPKFSYRFKKPTEDAIQAVLDKDSIRFRVSSQSGIGTGEIILDEGTWPRQVVLELGLRNLEHFIVYNGQSEGEGAAVLHGRLQARPKTVLYFERGGRPTEDASKAVYTLTIEQRGERLIEVTLPPGFANEKTKKLELRWIDAYRE